MTVSEEIKEALSALKKEHGDEIAVRGNEIPEIQRIPTGSIGVDYITGGGIPIGRWTRFYGGPSSGKSLLSYNIIANAQKMGLSCAYYNAEKQYTPAFAAKQGVNTEDLTIIETSVVETVGEALETLVAPIDVHIIDSCSNTVSRRELDDGLNEKEYYGGNAKVWKQQFKFIHERFDHSRNVIIYIDHANVQFGTMGGMTTLKPPGGKYMEHESSMTLEFKQSKWLFLKPDGSLGDTKTSSSKSLSGDTEPDGMEILIRCQKARVGRPLIPARLQFNFHTGELDFLDEYVEAAKFLDVVESSGGWIKLEGQEKSIRPAEFRELLSNDEGLKKQIYEKMMEHI